MDLYRNTFHDDQCPYLYIEDPYDPSNIKSDLERKLDYIDEHFKDKDPQLIRRLKDSIIKLYQLHDEWLTVRDNGLEILDLFEFEGYDEEDEECSEDSLTDID